MDCRGQCGSRCGSRGWRGDWGHWRRVSGLKKWVGSRVAALVAGLQEGRAGLPPWLSSVWECLMGGLSSEVEHPVLAAMVDLVWRCLGLLSTGAHATLSVSR